MNVRSFTVMLGIQLLFNSGEVLALDAREIAKNSFPSVVMLVMEDENGHEISLGSGFFVKEDVIASNFHVIENAARGYARVMGQPQKYKVAGLVGADYKNDIVLVLLEKAK